MSAVVQADAASVIIAVIAIVPGTLAALFAYLNGKRGKQVADALETGNGMGVGGYVVHLAGQVGMLTEKVDHHAAVLTAHTASDEESFAEIHEMLANAQHWRDDVKNTLLAQERAS